MTFRNRDDLFRRANIASTFILAAIQTEQTLMFSCLFFCHVLFPWTSSQVAPKKKEKARRKFCTFLQMTKFQSSVGTVGKNTAPIPRCSGLFHPWFIQYLAAGPDYVWGNVHIPHYLSKANNCCTCVCFISSWHYDSFNQHYSH